MDILVFGATGFTGGLVVEYLAEKEGLTWGIVGRNEDKLNDIAKKVQGRKSVPKVFVCKNVEDKETVDKLIQQTKVVLSTAGPYTLIGTPIVESCVRNGKDYVDITGEVTWVKQMMDKFHFEAVKNNSIICSNCGFDCIPSDLGVLYGVAKFWEKFGKIPIGKVTTYATMIGGMSGGTVKSGLLMESDPNMKNPFLLGGAPPGGVRELDQDYASYEYEPKLKKWIAPFMMANLNTKVVRKSNLWLNYGSNLLYREVAIAPNEKIAQKMAKPGPPAEKRSKMVEEGRLPSPGQGPSKKLREKSFFKFYIHVESEHNPEEKSLWVSVHSDKDPGYEETAKMVSEAALCLAFQKSLLAHQGGCLTPAIAMGSTLIERLDRNEIRFEQIPQPSTSAL